MKLDGSKLAIFSCGLDDGSSICSSLDSPVSPTPGVGKICSLPPPTPNLIKIRSPHLLPIWKHYFRGHVRNQDECIINWPISNSSTKSSRQDKHMCFETHPIDIECIHIATTVVSSNTACGEMYSIQHYGKKFVHDLRQVDGFLWVLKFPPLIKLNAKI